MSGPRRLIGESKRALKAAGIHGDTLAELVTNAVKELTRLRERDAQAREVLREVGVDPNGMRLHDALGYALRRAGER